MIRLGIVLGVARAETRLTRRLVRFWLFQGVAALLGIGGVVYYSILHRMFSHMSATAGLLNPRYLFGFIGIYYLVGFLLGLVFLGYDVRARDKRERIVEVLDALPCTNIELLLGRFIGILIPCWVPVVLISLLLLGGSAALGSPIEPFSIVTFVVFMAIPAYSFVLGLAFFLTLALRHRLLAGVALAAIIIGMVVINFGFVPIYMLPAVDITGGFSVTGPSDIIPGIIDLRGVIQRLSYLLAGFGFLWLGAAIHPRRDDASRAVTTGIGVGILVVAALMVTGLVKQGADAIDQRATWKQAHAARQDDPVPDMLKLSGDVRLGTTLDLDLELRFRAPDVSLDSALFTLNPGLIVESVTDSSGRTLDVTQTDGLLDVNLQRSLSAGEEETLQMKIRGEPDIFFGYIDSVFDPLDISIKEGNIFLLGFFSSILDRRYVALLPGIRWLPASGPDVRRGDPATRPLDFFEVDLTVDVPDSWLVAGPGRRQDVSGAEAGRRRFRFVPGAPLPDVALIAGQFVSRSMQIGDVTLEVLVNPKHESGVEFFNDAAGEIHDWLVDRFEEAEAVGLGYPYDGLTLVEVPNQLRGYAGGWRMDTTYAQPGLVLTRESGFATARFDFPFRDADSFRDEEGGVPRAKLEHLERFFENDFSGGNPFIAASRNFFSFQTAAEGPMGVALNYVCEDLAVRLITEKQGYFSVHHYGKDMGQTINGTIAAIFSGQTSDLNEALMTTVTGRTEVWNSVLEFSLEDLNPWEAPKKAFDVLTLKGGAMARSMLDDLGREKTGAVLASLRDETGGGSFTREDVIAAGEKAGADLAEWLDVWIGQTGLPGFTVPRVRYDRLADTEDGSPQYQFVLTVSNGEPTPGLIRLDYRTGEGDDRSDWQNGEPVRVPASGAVEIGVVTSEPLSQTRIVPYLALNRGPFSVTLPALDEERIVEDEPFHGAREVERNDVASSTIIVDDLDEGFAAHEPEAGDLFRVGGRGIPRQDTDEGLPVAQFGDLSARWARRTSANAYGTYRHTMAIAKAGKGDRKAVFTAEIPHAGEWELEYYLPERPPGFSRTRRRGTWSLSIIDPSGSHEVTLDADAGETGWNSLGSFEIADGETRVEVSNAVKEGRYVIADAIRWIPISGGPPRGTEAAP